MLDCCLVTESCPTLYDPTDCSPPGSSVHGTLRARILEWVAFPSPGDLPDPGIKPTSPALAGRFFTTEPAGKPLSQNATQQLRELLMYATSYKGVLLREKTIPKVYITIYFYLYIILEMTKLYR